ncbi:MAG: type I methionyl aminopeptidase [Candidatus Gracilibacteria bacterium]|nr:type I methionyl aminopeptidase [Candidatus Gracilibacteria bacterium]
MLNEKELEQLRKNALVHKKVFKTILEIIKPGTTAIEINNLCGAIAKEHDVLCGFKGVYDFPANICISVNDVVVHGLPRPGLVFKKGDLVTFDFGIKDNKYGVNTDAAISLIVGGDEANPIGAKLINANKKALYAGISKARAGNTVGDISAAIQAEIEGAGFYVVKDLTGHAIGKKLHEKPYIPNFGKAGAGVKLVPGMTLAIEPILGETSGKIVDEGDWEIYIEDGSLGSQYEHTILVTEGEPEIIV